MTSKQKFNTSDIEFIKKIKDIRIQLKLTQEQLAKIAGVSRVSIAQLETFKKKPNIKFISKIMDAIGIAGYNDELIKLKHIIENNDYNNLVEYKFKPIPISDKIITEESYLLELKKNTDDKFVFVPGKLATTLIAIGGVYAYIMPDNSMAPKILKGDFLVIKYVNLEPEDLSFPEYPEIVVLSNGLVRNVRKISYFTNDKPIDSKYEKHLIILAPEKEDSFEQEMDNDRRYTLDYIHIDNRTFLLDKESDIRIVGIVMTRVIGNLMDNIEINKLYYYK